MPIYEYVCGSCGHNHEAIQKMTDAPLEICPACGKSELKKRLSAAGFRLKGSGWYETDFKGGNKKASNETKPSKSDEPKTKTTTTEKQ